MMWTIKAIYSGGGHILRDGDKYRFADKQMALDKVEMLNADAKKAEILTRYIVIPEQ